MDGMQERLFDIKSDPNAAGKSIDSLLTSRQAREDILRLFGGVLPQSIMVADKRTRPDDQAKGSYDESEWRSEDANKKMDDIFGISGKGCGNGALSIFPQNIGDAMIKLYSAPGNTILDPFAGHNSRMELAAKNGRHYIGFDISHDFMEKNRAIAVKYRDKYQVYIELHEGDSREELRKIRDCIGDFTITSPPYYDIEDYGDEPGQLGKSKTYQLFLDGMGQIIYQNYRCLKPGSFCIYFVNDFRRKGKFHPYHMDTMQLLINAGFEINDMLIVDLGTPIRAAFATQVVEQKILPKRHEYGIICKKS